MIFKEFFDPYNLDHVLAFDELQKTGSWPEGFLPSDLKGQRIYFVLEATGILASAYIERVKKDYNVKD